MLKLGGVEILQKMGESRLKCRCKREKGEDQIEITKEEVTQTLQQFMKWTKSL